MACSSNEPPKMAHVYVCDKRVVEVERANDIRIFIFHALGNYASNRAKQVKNERNFSVGREIRN